MGSGGAAAVGRGLGALLRLRVSTAVGGITAVAVYRSDGTLVAAAPAAPYGEPTAAAA